jgi:hypothetical protein
MGVQSTTPKRNSIHYDRRERGDEGGGMNGLTKLATVPPRRTTTPDDLARLADLPTHFATTLDARNRCAIFGIVPLLADPKISTFHLYFHSIVSQWIVQ